MNLVPCQTELEFHHHILNKICYNYIYVATKIRKKIMKILGKRVAKGEPLATPSI